MKKIRTTIIIILALTANLLTAQDLNDIEYGAYLTGSKSLWKSAVDKRQAVYTKSKDLKDLYALVAAKHGLLNATMADKDEELFDKYVEEAEVNLETLIDRKYKLAESKALLSSVYGFEMGYSSWKGMYLGSKSSGLIEDALSLDNNSPLVWQVFASSKLFTPSMFGGDKNEAVKAYEKSVTLYEQNGDNKQNWRYLDALAWLGQAYLMTNQKDKAVITFEKALQQEPDFTWVSQVLLPKAKSK